MQQLFVILIGVFVFGYVIYKIYRTITFKPPPDSTCGGCSSCALKNKIKCV
jgi:hypothetical protein